MINLTLMQVALGLLLCVVAFVAWQRRQSRKIQARENLWLTNELKQAKLTMVEQKWQVEYPYNIVGRFDRVYEFDIQGKKVLMPVDFKTRARDRVFDSDIAEVSLQAWMLRQSGFITSAHGYIVIKNTATGATTPHRFALKSDVECQHLIEHYFNLTSKRILAKQAPTFKCKGCSHHSRCHT